MRILLTNDDGIDAPGLHALRQIALQLSDDVWVVAPEQNKSGAGHSLSLNEPIRLRQIDERTHAVRGTPTDCVIMGTRHVLKGKPVDLVLSGINRGANMAEDVTYSGTIAGAFEGTQMGIRSIALSQAFGFESHETPQWECALAHGADVIRKVLSIDWAPGILVNINFPDTSAAEAKPARITVQGKREMGLLGVDARRDTWGQAYYWLAYERRRSQTTPDTDLWAIYNNHISITPLSMNLTHAATRSRLQDVFGAN
jgi:5'-nucleotidase